MRRLRMLLAVAAIGAALVGGVAQAQDGAVPPPPNRTGEFVGNEAQSTRLDDLHVPQTGAETTKPPPTPSYAPAPSVFAPPPLWAAAGAAVAFLLALVGIGLALLGDRRRADLWDAYDELAHVQQKLESSLSQVTVDVEQLRGAVRHLQSEPAPSPPRADRTLLLRRPPVTEPGEPSTYPADRPAWEAGPRLATARSADEASAAESGPARPPAPDFGSIGARFAEATLDLSGAGESFMQDYRVAGANPDGSHYDLTRDAAASKLWAIPLAPGFYALTPGYQAILNWSAHFAPHRLTAAHDVFGAAFDLDPGGDGGLRLESMAEAREEAGRLRITRRGRLTGFYN